MNKEQTTVDSATDKSSTRYSACLLFSANALARATSAIGDEEFGRFGLSYSHAYLLCEVVDQPGILPSQLSEKLYLTPSTITRLVEKLEQKKLVRRESEGKRTLVYPTPEGEAIRSAVAEAWDRVGARCAELIGEENVCQLTKQIYKATQTLNRED